MTLCVVTATTDALRRRHCIQSWGEVPTYVTYNGTNYDKPYGGVVPIFRKAVDEALAAPQGWDLIACLHDDVEILDPHWIDRVCGYFAENPRMGLAGFGGAVALGDSDLYQKPYKAEQLARRGFRSNLVDAEVHGMRSLLPERVACLDGFSLILRRELALGQGSLDSGHPADDAPERRRPWTVLEHLGVVHHLYDGLMGALAARYGWETWYLPIACKHYGGQTAVGDPGYQRWAETQVAGGDRGFWEKAHAIGYEAFRDVLPLEV